MMNRRRWLGAGVGLAAAAAGAGWSWWRQQGSNGGGAHGGSAPGTGADSGAASPATSLWDLRLAQPDGGELLLAGLRGRPLVVNFWATWCPPCVKELPEIDQFAREQAQRGDQGWRVVGLAIDRLDAVQAFLAKTPVSYPIGLAGFEVTEISRALGNDAGGLPFTVVFNAAGEPLHRRLGSTSHAELSAWAAAAAG